VKNVSSDRIAVNEMIAVINVQLEKAQALRDKEPGEADQAIIDAKRLSREALQDIRSSVGTLRTQQELFS
jgi:signal transduction histidine kinase